MVYENEFKNLNYQLKADCSKCFGFCCIALYFSASEGFPTNKDAGEPCINLQSDFKCKVHNNLRQKGLKGCTAYDCFGAGQKVAQVTYSGRDWIKEPEVKKQMFDVFLVIRQLNEMLWYLLEARKLKITYPIHNKLKDLIIEAECISNENAESLIGLDIDSFRDRVNILLKQTSEMVRADAIRNQKDSIKSNKTISGRVNFIGADLRKRNLRGADLRGALLIAANLSGTDLTGADFIGADLRDTDLSGSNLKDSIFITQVQINTAKGDSNTKLPLSISRPEHWINK